MDTAFIALEKATSEQDIRAIISSFNGARKDESILALMGNCVKTRTVGKIVTLARLLSIEARSSRLIMVAFIEDLKKIKLYQDAINLAVEWCKSDAGPESAAYLIDTLLELGQLDYARKLFPQLSAAIKNEFFIGETSAKIAYWSGKKSDAAALFERLFQRDDYLSSGCIPIYLDSIANEPRRQECLSQLLNKFEAGFVVDEKAAIALIDACQSPADSAHLHRTHRILSKVTPFSPAIGRHLVWAYWKCGDQGAALDILHSTEGRFPALSLDLSLDALGLLAEINRGKDKPYIRKAHVLEIAQRIREITSGGNGLQFRKDVVVEALRVSRLFSDLAGFRALLDLCSHYVNLDDAQYILGAQVRKSGLYDVVVQLNEAAAGGDLFFVYFVGKKLVAGESPEGIKYNAAQILAANGFSDCAKEGFDAVTRIYRDYNGPFIWPNVRGGRWPYLPSSSLLASRKPELGVEVGPMVSIIIPTYNQGRFIEETILSIIAQDYRNIQLIIIDGASTDETKEIIKKYIERVDYFVSEEDEGQTQAINKGFAVAKGELVTWVNSDDMLAPGAVSAIVRAYQESDADIIFGLCSEFDQQGISLVNRPLADKIDYTEKNLTDVFKYWLKGAYFYQPEVFFTRRLLDKCGGKLDESLYYTMDYKFWLDAAKQSPEVKYCSYNVAYFRKHQDQKTSNLINCVDEQAAIVLSKRERMISQANDRFASKISALRRNKGRLTAGVYSSRWSKIFSDAVTLDIENLSSEDLRVVPIQSLNQARGLDIIIYLVHLQDDVNAIRAIRSANPSAVVVGWFWDNHHHLFENANVAPELDAVIPGHSSPANYLKIHGNAVFESQPLCVTQWSRGQAEIYSNRLVLERSNKLYGGFVDYPFAERRTDFIKSVAQSKLPTEIRLLDESNLKPYFAMLPSERFLEWGKHKASLCQPLNADLSQRFFDALLAGQIPLVPDDILDALSVAKEYSFEEHIEVFKAFDLTSLSAAHKRAIVKYDRGGIEAVKKRNRLVLDHFMFDSSISRILKRVLGA